MPLFMDKATTSLEKLAFARCFVEISANKPLQQSVKLEVDGEDTVQIVVEYEWLPPKCDKCNTFGHIVTHCPTKETWLPKERSKTPEATISQKTTSASLF